MKRPIVDIFRMVKYDEMSTQRLTQPNGPGITIIVLLQDKTKPV